MQSSPDSFKPSSIIECIILASFSKPSKSLQTEDYLSVISFSLKSLCLKGKSSQKLKT